MRIFVDADGFSHIADVIKSIENDRDANYAWGEAIEEAKRLAKARGELVQLIGPGDGRDDGRVVWVHPNGKVENQVAP